MAGVRKDPRPNGKFAAWYTDARGKIKYFVGVRSKPETLRMAQRLEDDHRQVRLKYRPAPTSADQHRIRPFADAAAEFQAWGEAQGGYHGRAWSATHAERTKKSLTFWADRLALRTLADLDDSILPRVESVLREMVDAGKAGATIEHSIGPLATFCRWAVKRGYLADNPLRHRTLFDTTAKSTRRALTADEIKRLLTAANHWRRMVYETALASGLRASELRSLTVADLDEERSGLRLHAEWTKARLDGFQPVPAKLVKKLRAFAESGEAARMYHERPPRTGKAPVAPVLYLPDNTCRMFEADRKAAGIAKRTFHGKVDFHALRVAYISGVLASGATLKEAQSLARHATPGLTLNVYGRAADERLAALAERTGATVLGPGIGPDIALSLHKKAACGETIDVTAIEASGNVGAFGARRGSRIPMPAITTPRRTSTQATQFPHKVLTLSSLAANRMAR